MRMSFFIRWYYYKEEYSDIFTIDISVTSNSIALNPTMTDFTNAIIDRHRHMKNGIIRIQNINKL